VLGYKPWNQRFFQLKESGLEYHNDKDSPDSGAKKPPKVISIDSITTVCKDPQLELADFKIATKTGRTFVLRGESRATVVCASPVDSKLKPQCLLLTDSLGCVEAWGTVMASLCVCARIQWCMSCAGLLGGGHPREQEALPASSRGRKAEELQALQRVRQGSE
jgi:hypothetical protein